MDSDLVSVAGNPHRMPENSQNTKASAAAARIYTPGYRAYILGVLFATYFLNFMDRTVIGVVLPDIKRAFQLHDWQIGVLGGAGFSLVYAASGLPIAYFADRRNRSKLLALAVAFWSLMTASCGLAVNAWQLLFTRAAVGFGEAASSPCAMTLISDLYDRTKRATAIGIYTCANAMGASAGILLGAIFASAYGWRWAFILIGLPGLLLALLVMLTVREPPRGLSDGRTTVPDAPNTFHVIGLVLSRKSFRQYVIGHALSSALPYIIALWAPSYLIRSFHVPLKSVGILLALTTCIAGLAGSAGGGFVSDWLSRKNVRWRLIFPAIANFAAIPFAVVAFTASSVWVACVALCIALIAPNTITGPGGSMVQEMVGVRMRGVAQALNLSIVAFFASGIAPFLIGVASDLLHKNYGMESLRFALLGSVVVSAWCGIHYYLASRHIEEDLRRAPP